MTTVLLIIILVLVGLATAKVFLSSDTASEGKATGDSAKAVEDQPEAQKRSAPKASQKGKQKFKKALKMSVEGRFPIVPLNRVPAMPGKFFGRKNYIADLALPSNKNAPLIGLCGPSGIGKTLLAVALTKNLRKKYPAEPIYIDMRGRGFDVLSCDEVMAKVIHNFRPKDKLPEAPAERLRWYKAILSRQKVILILDDVPDAMDVKNLMPPKNCGLIVISKNPRGLPGLVSRKLTPLSDSEAESLLAETSPRTGFYANEISKMSGNFPLTLLLAAHYISTCQQRDPSYFVETLREELKRLKPKPEEQIRVCLDVVLNISYRYLSEKSASMFRKLVIFPDAFDAKAETFICEDEDNQLLGNLLMQGLIINDKTTNRYHLHGHIRAFLRKRLKDNEKALARKRMATYYLTLLVAADELYSSGGKERMRGLNLFDAEWENIKTGQEWARANSKNEGEIDQLCLSYTEAAFSLLSLRRPTKERIAWFEAALNSAKRLNETELESKYLLWLGIENNRLDQHQEAFDYLEEALEGSRQLEDRTMERNVLGHLGLTYLALGKPHQAIEFLEKQLKLFEGSEDTSGIESNLQSLGQIYFQVGEGKRAIEYYKEELKKAKEAENPKRQARIFGDLGKVFTSVGNHESAIEHFEQGLALVQKIEDKDEETNLLLQLGDSYTEFGKINKGLPYYEQALALAQKRKNQKSMALILGQMGQSHLQSKNHREAIKCLQKATPLFKAMINKTKEGEMLWYWGQAEALSENFPLAVLKAEAALNILSKLNHADVESIEQQIAVWKSGEEPKTTAPTKTSATANNPNASASQ